MKAKPNTPSRSTKINDPPSPDASPVPARAILLASTAQLARATNFSPDSPENQVTKMAAPNAAAGSSPPGDEGGSGAHPTHVSEPAYEFLLGSILHWVESECSVERMQQQQQQAQQKEAEDGGDQPEGSGTGAGGESSSFAASAGPIMEELAILSAERAAAKIERLGFDVGYRLCERLAQSKPLGPGLPPPGSVGAASTTAVDPAAMQLEAVKFLCKEFWTEVFRKQIDKLQTNHRGVFVLKDHELRWLRRLPPEDETARVAAIKMLAFPCGLIRGALSNLGIAAVVSCDFLADGKNMAACSFNIKIKA